MSGPERLADPSRAFRLDGKVAVVTGASSGIGVALAEGLAAAGARVALAARREDRLEALAARLRAAGSEVWAFGCDVSSTEQVEQLARDVTAQIGLVDVLVNNAGIGNVVPAEHESVDGFTTILDVNLVGTFRCAQERRWGGPGDSTNSSVLRCSSRRTPPATSRGRRCSSMGAGRQSEPRSRTQSSPRGSARSRRRGRSVSDRRMRTASTWQFFGDS